MPQSVIDAVDRVAGRSPRCPSDTVLVVLELPRDARREVYPALASMPVRVVAIEEPPPMK